MVSTKVTLCPTCRTDGGWHFSDDDPDKPPTRCPNILAAELHKEALALTSVQNANALKAALAIVKDFAETHAELSGNETREAMQTAGVPSGTVGAAFSISATGDAPCIEATGRFVQSTDPATRHRIGVWRSLIHSSAVAAGVSRSTGRQSA